MKKRKQGIKSFYRYYKDCTTERLKELWFQFFDNEMHPADTERMYDLGYDICDINEAEDSMHENSNALDAITQLLAERKIDIYEEVFGPISYNNEKG